MFIERRGTGVPLVALHGNGVDHRLLLPLDSCFDEEAAWERIYLDLPGFGRTPALDGLAGLPELANWVVDTITLLLGDRSFALLANSLGGLLARHVAAILPKQVIGMALIAPVVDAAPARRTLPESTVVDSDYAFLAELDPRDRREFEAVAVMRTRSSWEGFRDAALPGIRAADTVAMARLEDRYFLHESPEVGKSQVEGPTLVITGKQDNIVGYVDQFNLLPSYRDSTYVVIDRAGHNVHLEQPDIVAALLRDWSFRMQAHARTG